jgi:hypothetical protein
MKELILDYYVNDTVLRAFLEKKGIDTSNTKDSQLESLASCHEICIHHWSLGHEDEELIAAFKEVAANPELKKPTFRIVTVEDGLSYNVRMKEIDGCEYYRVETWIEVSREELANGLSEEKLKLLEFCNDLRIVNPKNRSRC